MYKGKMVLAVPRCCQKRKGKSDRARVNEAVLQREENWEALRARNWEGFRLKNADGSSVIWEKPGKSLREGINEGLKGGNGEGFGDS
ncbi:hypothetical protein ACQKWADRAFT_300189 [Trichoderma austrokoningii]